MDPRHETFKEEILNQLIHAINDYIKNNLDEIVKDTAISDQIKHISGEIYHYLEMPFDTNAIITKKNLLSIDIVFFPSIADTEANKILKEEDFIQLIQSIQETFVHAPSSVKPLQGCLEPILNKCVTL